jgi:hypothetical protein
MARAEKPIRLPTFPGLKLKEVELGRGYSFGKPRGGRVDIIKTSTREKTITLECSCQSGGGLCSLTVVGGIATCSPDTCTDCSFVVTIPTGEAFVGYLGDVFKQ